MIIRTRLITISCVLALCFGGSGWAHAAQRASPKTHKTVLPSIASGPTGPIPQIPLDSIPALPPDVSYQNGKLTIIASNSTLSDILVAVQKQTGAEIGIPATTDRVVTRLGPGSAADVLSALLTGSHFNFVLVSSPTDTSVLKRVVLLPMAKDDHAAKATPVTLSAPRNEDGARNQSMQEQPEEPQGMLETPDEL